MAGEDELSKARQYRDAGTEAMGRGDKGGARGHFNQAITFYTHCIQVKEAAPKDPNTYGDASLPSIYAEKSEVEEKLKKLDKMG